MRRAEPLHPPALLVDQDRGVRVAQRFSETVNNNITCDGLSIFRLNRMRPHGGFAQELHAHAAIDVQPRDR